MILACLKCNTHYLVADASIGSAGRTVRCANCGHSWFEAPPDSFAELLAELPKPQVPHPATDSPRKRPLPPGSNLPVVVITHVAPNWLKYLCVMLLPLLLILTPFVYRKSILESHPELSFLLEPFGIYYTDGLALADITLSKLPADSAGNVRYTLGCNVINEAKGSRELPAVAATLLDNKGRTVAKSPNLAETGKNVLSGAVEHCAPYSFQSKNGSVATVRIDLADLFDLTLRKK